MLTITFLILVVPMLLMILTVSTVSLSAVFPLCLVRLVGGGEDSKAKNNNHFHYVNHYTNSVTSQNIIKDLNLVLIRILMSNSNYYDKNYP